MSEDYYLASMKGRLLAIECELQAMMAKNYERAIKNQTQAYEENDFDRLRVEALEISVKLMEKY